MPDVPAAKNPSSIVITGENSIFSPGRIWMVILASSVGTMIEWYDFYIFGSLATILAAKFYPQGNATFALIAYLSTFAVGFLVRPFGALFFGRIGDLVGRKYAFLVTLIIMGSCTFLIGLMPTFATAGWFAPIALIAIRVLQESAIRFHSTRQVNVHQASYKKSTRSHASHPVSSMQV